MLESWQGVKGEKRLRTPVQHGGRSSSKSTQAASAVTLNYCSSSKYFTLLLAVLVETSC